VLLTNLPTYTVSHSGRLQYANRSLCLARHVHLGYEEINCSGTDVGKQIMIRNNKVQGKVIPAHARKAFGNGGINLLIPNLGSGWG